MQAEWENSWKKRKGKIEIAWLREVLKRWKEGNFNDRQLGSREQRTYEKLMKYHTMKTWMSGGIAPRILNLGTSWRLVVNFTSLPHYPLGRRLGGPQSRPEHGCKEKKTSSLPGIESRSSSVAESLY
jgi:hypothetical protein